MRARRSTSVISSGNVSHDPFRSSSALSALTRSVHPVLARLSASKVDSSGIAPCVRRCAINAWLVVLGSVVDVDVSEVGSGIVISLLVVDILIFGFWFESGLLAER